jgi:hypothetical protein
MYMRNYNILIAECRTSHEAAHGDFPQEPIVRWGTASRNWESCTPFSEASKHFAKCNVLASGNLIYDYDISAQLLIFKYLISQL